MLAGRDRALVLGVSIRASLRRAKRLSTAMPAAAAPMFQSALRSGERSDEGSHALSP